MVLDDTITHATLALILLLDVIIVRSHTLVGNLSSKLYILSPCLMTCNSMTEDSARPRRSVLRGAGAMAGASMVGGLSGCLGDEEPADDTNGGGVSDDELTYWGIDTAFPPSGWDPFEDESGIELEASAAPWRQGEVMNRMVVGGGDEDFDIVQMDSTLTDVVAGEGAIQRTDLESLELWEETYPEVHDNEHTEVDGEQFSLTSLQNGDSVVCLPEHVGDANEVTSYGVLFDDEFAGRTALEAGFSMPFPKTAQYLAYNDLADISPEQIDYPDEETIDTVIDFLEEQNEEGQFRTFWSGWESAVNLVASEEVYAMDTWEPVVFALRNEGMDAYYLEPDEGFAIWSHGPWMTNAGKEKEDAVNQFVSWLMDGYYGADVTSETGYLTATPRAIDYAEESDDYDAEAIADVHEDVLENRLRHPNSSFSDNFPSAEIFQYLNSEWDRLTS